jgi:hypothetical protein
MWSATTRQDFESQSHGWSNRILILSLLGTFFLTFYPFRFSFHEALPGDSPFLLGPGKNAGAYDDFLNILLFVPFGFGLAEKLGEKVRSRLAILAATFLAGVLLSYFIEFVQAYIPSRDSGWRDIITNSSGSAVGFFLFELCGLPLVRVLSRGEAALRTLLARRHAWILIPLYFAIWIALSMALQTQTRLGNWDSDALLTVGNDAAGENSTAWRGEMSLLQFWDRALPPAIAQQLTTGDLSGPGPAPLASFDFSKPPFRDANGALPDLIWRSQPPKAQTSGSLVFDGSSSLRSTVPVSTLTSLLKRGNQLSVRVVCRPAVTDAGDERLVSISRKSGPMNFQMREENSDLMIWLRTPLSAKRLALAWRIPGIFEARQTRDILFSYDGSDASLYVDGSEVGPRYRWGPGAALAHMVRSIKAREVPGYEYVYYLLVFFPAGILLCASRQSAGSLTARNFSWMVLVVFAASLLLEFALVLVSGRAFFFPNVGLSAFSGLAGILWLDSDRATPSAPRGRTTGATSAR